MGSNKVLSQRRPHFFKIFTELSEEKLGIPARFLRHIGDQTQRDVSLKGPGGDVWNAKLVRDLSGLSIQNGWKTFVKDHSILLNDFLLFRYDGNSQFTVLIFGRSACEKEDAFFASSCHEVAIIGYRNAKEKALVSVVEDICDSPPHDCFHGLPEPGSGQQTSGAGNNSSEKNIDYSGGSKRQKISRSTENDSRENIGILAFVGASDGNNLVPCNYRKIIGSIGSHTLEEQPPSAIVIKEEPTEFVEPSSLDKRKDPVNKTCAKKRLAKSELLLKKSISCRKYTRKESHLYAELPKERTKLNHESGRVVIKARMSMLVSNRRPVTEQEVRKASEAAKMFTSRNPTAHVVMRDSYVYYGFYLNLPNYFVKSYLPKSKQKMKLWDPNGKSWMVNFVVSPARGGFAAHWGEFSLANNLERDDVCIFELVGRDTMKVHIFRVIEETTPLTRLSSRHGTTNPVLMLEYAKGNNTRLP